MLAIVNLKGLDYFPHWLFRFGSDFKSEISNTFDIIGRQKNESVNSSGGLRLDL